jgi:hypothetical protein
MSINAKCIVVTIDSYDGWKTTRRSSMDEPHDSFSEVVAQAIAAHLVPCGEEPWLNDDELAKVLADIALAAISICNPNDTAVMRKIASNIVEVACELDDDRARDVPTAPPAEHPPEPAAGPATPGRAESSSD